MLDNLLHLNHVSIKHKYIILFPKSNKVMSISNRLINYYTIIFFIALLLRVAFHFYSPISFFPDSTSYIHLSKIIFSGVYFEDNQAMPGYPIFLFLSDKIFSNYFILDILVSSFLVLIAGKLYYKIFKDELGAKICVLFFAIYPFNILYASLLLSENSYIFFNIVGFTFLYSNRNVLGSLFIVISILIRPTLDLLNIIIIMGVSYFVFKDHYKITIKKIIIFIGLYCVILSPWWIYNYERFGQFVKLTPGFGLVIYSGNNELNKTGGGNYREDFNFDIIAGEKDPLKKNKIMRDAAINFIIENPIRFIELSIKRFIRFFNVVPNYKSSDIIDGKHTHKLIFCASAITMLCLYLFSLLGLISLKKDKFVKLLPLFIYFILVTGIHIVTISSIRYRFPIEFILLILSSFYISTILNKVDKNNIFKFKFLK